MAVRIRLRRIGRKKQPSYRLVAAESTNARSGAYLETLGFYNPRTQPAELRVDLERVDFWVANGATMSDTADSLVRKARRGGDAKVKMITTAQEPTASVVALPEPTPETAEPPAKPARGRKTAAKSAPVEAAAAAEVTEAAAPDAAESAAPAAEAETPATEPTDAAAPGAGTPEAAASTEAEAAADEAETAEAEKPAAE